MKHKTRKPQDFCDIAQLFVGTRFQRRAFCEKEIIKWRKINETKSNCDFFFYFEQRIKTAKIRKQKVLKE